MKRDSRAVLLLVVGGMAAIAGCGNNAAATASPDDGDAGPPVADLTGDGGGDANVPCNSFQIVTPAVTEVAVSGKAPVAMGGMVVDGTYILTAENHYAGEAGTISPMGGTRGAALSIMQGTWNYAVTENGGPYVTETATVMYGGTTVTQTFTCSVDEAQTRVQEYTATPTELRIYSTSVTSVDEAIFTIQ